MKHLDGEPCFIEMNKPSCALMVEYLGHTIDWYKEHGIRGEIYSVNEYIKMFKSMYGDITINEELERR
jgi:hypothetical protein